jgi:hypothetical protein
MKPKKKPNKGLSDEELIKKYEAGKIDLKKEIKKNLPKKKI